MLEMFMIKASRNIISYMLNIDEKTIYNIMEKVKKKLIPEYYASLEKIGGDDVVVEIDESKFGKRKYNKGHKVEGVWILGMVEKSSTRRIILRQVDDRTKNTLFTKIEESIYKDTKLHTDMWKGYMGLEDHYIEHLSVNHSENYKDPITGCHTNTIEGEWAGIKMHVPPRARTKEKVEIYLVRYMILRNEAEIHPLDALIKYLF